MLHRRRLLSATIASSAFLAAAPRAFASAPTLTFRVSRDGTPIGSHAVSFAGDPAANLTATIDVQIAVRVLGIRVFHYFHHTIEKWEGGRFVSLDSTTDDDGDKAYATVRRSGDTLAVDGSLGSHFAAGNTLPATHWNVAELRSPMLNPENGRMIHAQIGGPTRDRVAQGSGAKIAAAHYTWRGDDTLDLYYADDGSWAGLTALAKDKSQLVYTRA